MSIWVLILRMADSRRCRRLLFVPVGFVQGLFDLLDLLLDSRTLFFQVGPALRRGRLGGRLRDDPARHQQQ